MYLTSAYIDTIGGNIGKMCRYRSGWRQGSAKPDSFELHLRWSMLVRKYLLDYQELEYGIAFSIARPLFHRIGTTMLISGALGLFRTNTVIEIGGYALDTVGEDMELIMKIRQIAAKKNARLGLRMKKDRFAIPNSPGTYAIGQNSVFVGLLACQKFFEVSRYADR